MKIISSGNQTSVCYGKKETKQLYECKVFSEIELTFKR